MTENRPPADEKKDNSGAESPAPAVVGGAVGGAAAEKDKGKKQAPVGARGRSAVFVDIVFNIILLCSVAFIGFMIYEQDKAIDVLFDQQNAFGSQRDNTGERFNQLQNELQDLASALSASTEENAAAIQQQATEQTALMSAEIDRLQNELISTRLRITDNNPGASQQWLLAEAASLLRLAEQHLLVARNVRTAQALFIAADDVLKQIDDPAIFSVREILAGELASLRAINEVDIQSIYIQLGAVAEQTGRLQVNNDLAVQLAEGEKVTLTSQVQEDDSGWLASMFASIRNTLDNYLVVRRRDVPIQPLMTPGQEAALMQTVQLQIEQGRTALLKEEQEIYSASLEKARNTIDRFLAGNPSVKSGILNTLDDLGERRIVTEPPPLSRTRAALGQILSASQGQPAGPVSQE